MCSEFETECESKCALILKMNVKLNLTVFETECETKCALNLKLNMKRKSALIMKLKVKLSVH